MAADCDDHAGRHQWHEPFADGDSCACGAFYLDLHPHPKHGGIFAEVKETPAVHYDEPEEE